MANDTVERPSEARRRGPLTWVVVGVAVIVAGIGLVVAVARTGSNPPPAPDGPAVVLHLTGPQADGRCMVPSADMLASKTLAFAGTVETAEAGTVTITASEFYAGGPADVVELRYPHRITDGSVDLAAGQSVLIAADAGQVLGCGLSGVATDELAALYDQAFGG
ncbi:hypothetical protein BH09ACT11_BH09ACT11_19070 [soil metagenome]